MRVLQVYTSHDLIAAHGKRAIERENLYVGVYPPAAAPLTGGNRSCLNFKFKLQVQGQFCANALSAQRWAACSYQTCVYRSAAAAQHLPSCARIMRTLCKHP
eukprot:TRINITY_DN25686_c0_g1_i1.p1 TRINITY_DN25686_c0_g1~~TRINITY_DN25686_c0_g1_i1.p1  ORF type:complete len:102 (+),score=6.42 TRINITY_DN25686_c0_g1_i1:282-587(+)